MLQTNVEWHDSNPHSPTPAQEKKEIGRQREREGAITKDNKVKIGKTLDAQHSKRADFPSGNDDILLLPKAGKGGKRKHNLVHTYAVLQ